MLLGVILWICHNIKRSANEKHCKTSSQNLWQPLQNKHLRRLKGVPEATRQLFSNTSRAILVMVIKLCANRFSLDHFKIKKPLARFWPYTGGPFLAQSKFTSTYL